MVVTDFELVTELLSFCCMLYKNDQNTWKDAIMLSRNHLVSQLQTVILLRPTVFRSRGLHGCGGHGDSAGNPRGRLRSVRGIRGIGLLTAQGHRGAGARREVTLHAAHAQHQHHSNGQVSAVCALCTAVHCTAVYLEPTPPSVKGELSTDQATATKVHSPHHWALY